MNDDTAPAAKVAVSRMALQTACDEASALARLLDEAGLDQYGDTLRRWVVAPWVVNS